MKKTTKLIKDRKLELQAELQKIERNEGTVNRILGEDLPKARQCLVHLLLDLEEHEAAEDYTEALLPLVQSCGERGVSLSILRQVFPDSTRLDEAREKANLANGGNIKERKIGQTIRLTANQVG